MEAAENSDGEISGFRGVLYKFGMFLYESSISDETFYLLLRKQTDNLYITFFISHESYKENNYPKKHFVIDFDVYISDNVCPN